MAQPSLHASYQNQIVQALPISPCGRCGKNHKLMQCPMGPSDGYQGNVWANIPKQVRKAADDWLKAHPLYDPPPMIPKKPNDDAGVSATVAKVAALSLGHQTGRSHDTFRRNPQSDSTSQQPWQAVSVYSNGTTNMEMYYPASQLPPNLTTIGNGKVWNLPDGMEDRSTLLPNLDDPKYGLRTEFFDANQPKNILTNHFEYKLHTETFYEYTILDLSTKNRKKLRALFRSAIATWPCLQQNQANFATNYIDTIVAWRPLHDNLEPDAEEKEDADVADRQIFGPYDIPLGNDNVRARFELVKQIDAHSLVRYAAADPNFEDTNFDEIARCLNIVISKGFDHRVHKLSSNKFFVKTARTPLVDGNTHHSSNSLEMCRGYYYNVKPGMGNIILNFNLSTSAIFRPILVSEFMVDGETFGEFERRKNILSGKQVYIEFDRTDKDPQKQAALNHEDSRYWKVCGLQDGNIEDLEFRKKLLDAAGQPQIDPADGSSWLMEANPTRVVDHLFQVFGRQPRRSKPAVNVGTRHRPIWYAQEFLRIVPYQPYTRPVPDNYTAAMVREACRNPETSRAFIEREGLPNIGFTVGGLNATNFGSNIPVSLVPTMLQVPHRIEPMPRAQYSVQNSTEPGTVLADKKSHWKFPKASKTATFLKTRAKVFKYAIFRDPRTRPEDLTALQTRFESQLDKCGLTTAHYSRASDVEVAPFLSSLNYQALKAKLQLAAENKVDLVILLLRFADVAAYRNLKDLCDRFFGMQCLCVTVKNGKEHIMNETMTNIMMKVNLKLGGVNHTVTGVKEILSDTMVLGGDLIHPGTGAFEGTPSIAAIVGSVDPYGGKCLGSLRLQDVDKTDREIMDKQSLTEMVLERLQAYHIINERKLPANIIYFRDGVSSGHYSKVRDIELEAIRDACKSALIHVRKKGTINLAAVIVTKRHHTRFYPQKPTDGDRWGNNNTLPGTCVDQLVTSPYYQDFYLQSHSGIKGTARPAHYFVLENNVSGLTLDRLRTLTHNLCYSYVRSMSGVSYASPTYYADRLCERGRLYIRRFYLGDDDDLKKDLHDEKRKLEDAQLKKRQARFGAKEHRKTVAERKMEADHADEVKKRLKQLVSTRVEDEFYVFRKDSDGLKRWMNPYSKRLSATMFWM